MNQQELNKTQQLLNENLNHRRENDNLIFACRREELDTVNNTKKEDRVIIIRLTSKDSAPTTFEDRKNGCQEL
jgi:hypothetical protein